MAEHESAECRAVSRPAMCLMGIRLLADGVKRCPQLKEYDEYYVKRLCGRIRTICLMSRANLEALLAAKVKRFLPAISLFLILFHFSF